MKDRVLAITENVLIDGIARHFSRSPRQVNRLHESDSEIVGIPGLDGYRLAITIDTVSEEIQTGLYHLPETMGWIAVMASLSDIAAVGAEPVGLVMAMTFDRARDGAFRSAVARGVELACRRLDCHVLGGDTNAGAVTALTGCAVGTVPDAEIMLRVGCNVGDAVFVTGALGIGNALGLVRLTGLPEGLLAETEYRPIARVREGRVARRFASCCMDTSDGLLATLDQLMRLNDVGFQVKCDWEELLDPRALDVCRKAKVPPWTMIAGPHGEFELLLCIRQDQVKDFEAEARAAGVTPLRIGTVQQAPAVILMQQGRDAVSVDVSALRNMFDASAGDVRRYIADFLAFGQTAGLDQP